MMKKSKMAAGTHVPTAKKGMIHPRKPKRNPHIPACGHDKTSGNAFRFQTVSCLNHLQESVRIFSTPFLIQISKLLYHGFPISTRGAGEKS
jgi:hypothetical protein